MVKHTPARSLHPSFSLLPSLLTTFNLLCGLLVIVLSVEAGSAPAQVPDPLHFTAGWLIFAAMIFDYLDGKAARLVKVSSPVGIRLDSLTDLVSFGIAPMVLVYSTLLKQIPEPAAILACGIYLLAGSWRLARFNCDTGQGTASNLFFTGLPIPAAASFLASVVLITPGPAVFKPRLLGFTISAMPPHTVGWMVTALMLFLAFLMVSRIKFPAFKKINQQTLILLAGSAAFFLVLSFLFPWPNILFLIMLIYLIFGLFGDLLERVLATQKTNR